MLTMDVYRLCERFEINDPSGATQHAIKKLVCAGQRGSKGLLQDLQEAVDTINRRIEMIYEDKARDALLPTAFGQQNMIDPADVEPASAIEDDSERMQIIGQSGEMASEVYAAVDSVDPWSGAPEWAKYKAQDCNGCWYWFDFMPEQHNIEWRVGHSRGVALYASPGDKNPNWVCTLIARK